MKRWTIAALLAALAMPALAHHSIAVHYDQATSMTVDGVVTQYLWRNPHVFIYLEVTDEAGSIQNWVLQWQNTQVLRWRGLGPESIQPGERLTVSGSPERHEPQRLWITDVERQPDGVIFEATDEERYLLVP